MQAIAGRFVCQLVTSQRAIPINRDGSGLLFNLYKAANKRKFQILSYRPLHQKPSWFRGLDGRQGRSLAESENAAGLRIVGQVYLHFYWNSPQISAGR